LQSSHKPTLHCQTAENILTAPVSLQHHFGSVSRISTIQVIRQVYPPYTTTLVFRPYRVKESSQVKCNSLITTTSKSTRSRQTQTVKWQTYRVQRHYKAWRCTLAVQKGLASCLSVQFSPTSWSTEHWTNSYITLLTYDSSLQHRTNDKRQGNLTWRTQPSIPPGSVNEYQLCWEGKGRYGSFRKRMNVGCAGKTVRSLENACHTWVP